MTTIVAEENSNFEEKYYTGILFGLIKLLQNKKLKSVAENFPNQNPFDTSGVTSGLAQSPCEPTDLHLTTSGYRSKPVLKVRIYSNELTPLDDMALTDNFQLDGNVHAKIKRQNLILISDFFNVGAEKERFTVAVTLDMRSIFNFRSVECNSVGPLSALGPFSSERVNGSLRNSSFEGSTIDEVNEFLKFINDSFTYSREYKENLALEFHNALDLPVKADKISCPDPTNIETIQSEPLQSLVNIAGPSGHEFHDFRNDENLPKVRQDIGIRAKDISGLATIPPERPKSLVMWDSSTEYVSSPFESLAQSEKARQVLAYNYNFYILSPIY